MLYLNPHINGVKKESTFRGRFFELGTILVLLILSLLLNRAKSDVIMDFEWRLRGLVASNNLHCNLVPRDSVLSVP